MSEKTPTGQTPDDAVVLTPQFVLTVQHPASNYGRLLKQRRKELP